MNVEAILRAAQRASLALCPLFIASASVAAIPDAGARTADESALLAADEQQRLAVGSANVAAIKAGSDPHLRVNAPNNRIVTRDDLMRMVASGEIRNEVFERTREDLVITGDVGVVMGHETVFPGAASEQARMYGQRTLHRRYTNVYLRSGGVWRHLARHANVIPEPAVASPAPPAATGTVKPAGLILQIDEGERRVRRPKEAGLSGLPDPFILKVDRRNGGSKDLVMGYEEIAPGQAIRAHRHLMADEIIFVHHGSAQVELGKRHAKVETGGTVYIPSNTRIAMRNNGSQPLGIAFIFSKPGFEEMMRDNSVLEGQPVTVLTAEERARIEAKNRWHTQYDRR